MPGYFSVSLNEAVKELFLAVFQLKVSYDKI